MRATAVRMRTVRVSIVRVSTVTVSTMRVSTVTVSTHWQVNPFEQVPEPDFSNSVLVFAGNPGLTSRASILEGVEAGRVLKQDKVSMQLAYYVLYLSCFVPDQARTARFISRSTSNVFEYL